MSNKLFIDNLSLGTTDKSLRQVFSAYGEVTDAIIVKDRETGRPRGFGFVTFADKNQASAALQQLNDHEFEGRRIIVSHASSRDGDGDGGYQAQQGRSDGEWGRQ